MCESLPLTVGSPWRLGNERLCARCRAGDCARCDARHATAAFCEHPCPWVVPPHFPIPREEH